MIADEKNCFVEQFEEKAGKQVAVESTLFVKGKKASGSSKMLDNFKAPFDATVVERLNKAGFSIAGTTNTSEFGAGSSTESSYLGITPNAYNNSVAGLGAVTAIAEKLIRSALGSDANGSAHIQAVRSGISFIKPTYGTVSRYGMIANASSMEQIGVYAASVSEGFEVLETISGYDEKDGTSYPNAKYQYEAKQSDLQGIKVGIPNRSVTEEDSDTIKIFEEKMTALGAAVEYFDFKYDELIETVQMIISSAEFCNNISRFDGVKYGYRTKNYENINDLLVNSRTEAFHFETKQKAMLGSYVLSEGMYEKYYDKALRVRRLIKEEAEAACSRFDVVLAPINEECRFTSLGNVTGYPGLSLPCEIKKDGMPTGVQIIAKEFNESVLLQIGKLI